jgi:hypothetical protein
MDSFISQKGVKRAASVCETLPSSTVGYEFHENSVKEEDESTEIKLATLASLYPGHSQDALLESLITANGSIHAVRQTLESFAKEKYAKHPSVIGVQTSLASFGAPRDRDEGVARKKSRILTRKGQTLHLYSADDIAEHTPCSIIHNFLPPGEADELLKELLQEARTFERQTFKLFDNIVQSPHTACFYVDSLEEQQRQQTEYLYNGSYLTVCSDRHDFPSSPSIVISKPHLIGCTSNHAADARGFDQGANSC